LSKVPLPAAGLSRLAREEWKKLAPVAHRLGTLTEADLRGFALLCEALGIERQAREAVASEGMTTSTADGGLKPHPAVRIMEGARRDAARLLESFGLNPKGRGTVETAPEKTKKGGSTWAGVLKD
jgi:P27 family predicted phage terminase small subunit